MNIIQAKIFTQYPAQRWVKFKFKLVDMTAGRQFCLIFRTIKMQMSYTVNKY